MMAKQIVYYFDQIPTIGFCKECDEVAIYHDGLICPKCRTKELSIFVWDKESPHPEGG